VRREEPRPRSAYKVWRTIPTRWADNDSYGHVNNVVFYSWFDTAVNAWLVEAGLLDIAHGDPIGLVVATRCAYFAPLAFPETAEAGIAVDRLGASSVTYRIGIFTEGSDNAAAQGEFTHVYVDRETRKPAPLPAGWRVKLEGLA
jgi:acyl-CoA thioester hydrolase